MRRALLLTTILVACHPKPRAAPEDAGPAPIANVAVIADAAPAPETPLAWGTRPPEKGPLYPIVDGYCAFGTITPLEGKTIYTANGTFARFEDDGLVVDPAYEKNAEKGKEQAWAQTAFTAVSGTWPRLVLFSGDRGMGRMRAFESIWVHEEAGWSYFGSSDEKDQPSYSKPVLFKDWLVTWRRSIDPKASYESPSGLALMQAWPMKKDAPAIPGLASLARAKFNAYVLAAAGDSLYAFGYDEGSRGTSVLRVLKDGKVTEGADSHQYRMIIGRKDDSLFVLGDDSVIRRFDGVKATALPFKLAQGAWIVGTGFAPNGDVWALSSKGDVMVLHDGIVTTTALPSPPTNWALINGQHGPENDLLAGVEQGDPYAISENGSLYHLENGEWNEVALPRAPFATTGKYRAKQVVMATKGDPYVSIGYSEKGIGWKDSKRYNAVVRTRRPKEVLRCNEAPTQFRPDRDEIGHGFFSAPPVAHDDCTTPFVILLRLGSKQSPNYLYDRGYPTLRAAIKETPGLGAIVELVEIPWGTVQVLGAKAPDMASAKALAENAAKRVKHELIETQPEIVCGTPPTIDKTLRVDVATGKFVTTDAN